MAPDLNSEKSLPHNLEAERSVLGAILVDNGALHLAQQSLKAEDFYREGHRKIYIACERLGERGTAIDLVTVRDELERNAELEGSGGAAYLAALVDGVPRSAHIEHYVRIVKDRASMRRLIGVASEILRKAYTASEESDVLLDEAERMVFAAGQERLRSGFLPAHAIAESTFRTIEELSNRKELITGIETGFSQLDDMTSGLQKGELIIVAARPSMGKTAFCLNVAQHAALRRGARIGIFSLEMSREQLFTRMVCAEGRIDAHALRRGLLNKKGWNDLRLAFDTLAAAPVWIDDTPGTSVTEMRAKVMRLKAEHGVDLVMVDYLQLMGGRGRYESRQQEISDISRSLKEMAKELGVPVVAASQLSRAPEQRGSSDRRPQLSDLRECLAGDAILTDALTGERRPLADLFTDRRPVHVFTLTPDYRLARATAALVVQSGLKKVFRLRTRTGREIRASANHPFLTVHGWRPLDRLGPGTEIAVPRAYPPLRARGTISPDRGRLLGYLLSDGSYCRHRAVSFISADPVVLDDARAICEREFGFSPRNKSHWSGTPQIDFSVRGQFGPGRNPLIHWLKSLGIHGEKLWGKRVPPSLFACGEETTSHFLAGLYSGDGSIVRRDRRYVIKYSSTSRQLLRETQSLLLRLGILSTLRPPARHPKSTVDIADLVIEGKEPVCAFANRICLPGRKGNRLDEAHRWSLTPGENPHLDRIPLSVSDRILQLKERQGHSWRSLGYRVQGKRIGRSHLQSVAVALQAPDLAALACSDVLWDPIVSITEEGVEQTYDLVVPGTHNFTANDIIVHNSGAIEQDADVVMFIFRPEVYGETADNKGLAEILVRKQRNGPTGEVQLMFVKDFTLFANPEFRSE